MYGFGQANTAVKWNSHFTPCLPFSPPSQRIKLSHLRDAAVHQTLQLEACFLFLIKLLWGDYCKLYEFSGKWQEQWVLGNSLLKKPKLHPAFICPFPPLPIFISPFFSFPSPHPFQLSNKSFQNYHWGRHLLNRNFLLQWKRIMNDQRIAFLNI